MSGPLALGAAVPILFVRDVSKAAEFYVSKLGFAVEFLHGDPPFYGEVRRDAAALHLRHVPQPNFAELAAREESLILATIALPDVRALYAEFEGRGTPFAQHLVQQPWGGLDFQVEDPDGNRISFVTYHDPG